MQVLVLYVTGLLRLRETALYIHCHQDVIGGVRGPHGNGLSVLVDRWHDGTCSVM